MKMKKLIALLLSVTMLFSVAATADFSVLADDLIGNDVNSSNVDYSTDSAENKSVK